MNLLEGPAKDITASSGKISAYFSHLVSYLGSEKSVKCVAIAHMVPNTLFFAPALDSMVTLSALLAKPKSVTRPEYALLSQKYNTPTLTREWAANPAQVIRKLEELKLDGKDVIFVDIGGYFSQSIDDIASGFSGRIIGLLEGTENGAAKYEKVESYKTPIITVARSPLKLPEDHLVASSIVFSIEAVLREQAEILQTRTAAVIGYGRVGSSIADILRGRGINTVIHDEDPIKLAAAAARGFQASNRLDEALSHSSLVVCATGNKALTLQGFGMLRSGCIVASVTSADDEFDLGCLAAGYIPRKATEDLMRYEENKPGGRHFFLISNGNAANFIHGAVIGPAIQLIEGEKLMAIKALIDGRTLATTNGLKELDGESRREVAEIWIEHFL